MRCETRPRLQPSRSVPELAQRNVQDKILQPARKHYGGQGYAKESVFLPLTEPDFAQRFAALWDEHIPGFSGKVRSLPIGRRSGS